MMDWTDRHDRYFLRLLSKHALLYTEMITTGAVIHGDRQYLLRFNGAEHPVGLQLGGSDPSDLRQAAIIGEDFGYDEINLNVGCPSDRVQSGSFGACLMAEPDLVAECVVAMAAAVRVPVTVKCRIGIDEQDPATVLPDFVSRMAQAGCRTLIVHARKALLKGLSPKENRDVPPLNYDLVYRVKAAHPELEIVINGGIENLNAAEDHLAHVDGVMLGRAAYQNPYLLAEADQRFFGRPNAPISRSEVIAQLLPYVDQKLAEGAPLHAITRHILGLFNGQRGARAWRRTLSEGAYRPGADRTLIQNALDAVSEHADDAAHA
jgi:tRNA-dihydrouridine synthase A